MIDEPDAVTLLDAMAKTLDEHVVPTTTGGAQHATRVVANLCRVIARDLAAESPGHELLLDWAGYDDHYEDLISEFDALVAESTDDDERGRALTVLLADAAHRAEIAKPGYTDHGST